MTRFANGALCLPDSPCSLRISFRLPLDPDGLTPCHPVRTGTRAKGDWATMSGRKLRMWSQI
jgi:hypothetical protein